MIYFITQSNRYIKIGHVKGSPHTRLYSLQSGNPYTLKIALVIEGTKSDEGFVQRRFSRYHVRGEWFFLSSEIEDYLEERRGSCVLYEFKTDIPAKSGQRSWILKGKRGLHKWD